MNPGKQATAAGQGQDISSLWSSLGGLRSSNTDTRKHPGSLAPLTGGGTRRKVSRKVDRTSDECTSQKSQRADHRENLLQLSPQLRPRESVHSVRAQNGLSDESPKRVDFSNTHQLREINWDGTYLDSLAYPPDLGGSFGNISLAATNNAHDRRETDLPFLSLVHAQSTAPTALAQTSSNSHSHGSTSPPFTPPPSISNSTSNFHLISPPSSRSTSPPSSSSPTTTTTRSSASRSTTETIAPDVRWGGQAKELARHTTTTSNCGGGAPGKISAAKNNKVKLTKVDLQTTTASSARTGLVPAGTNDQPGNRPRQKGLTNIRKQVDDKWQSPYKALNKSTRDAVRAQGRLKPIEPTKGAASAKMDTRAGGESVSGAEGMSLASPRLPVPFKLSITAELKEDDKVMLKLKEKLKQQRALANSSVSESNDSSLTEGSSSSALPHKVSTSKDAGPERPRKVAASHHSLSYKGFSEVSPEHIPWRPNTKMAGIKKNGGFKKQLPLQLKKHDIDAVRHQAPQPSPEKPKKATRLVSAANKKSPKSGVTNIITTSSWRAGQELVMKELGLPSKVKSRPSQGEGTHETHHKSSTAAGSERGDEQHSRKAGGTYSHPPGDGATGSGGCDKNDGEKVDEVVGSTRLLSRETKNLPPSETKQANLEEHSLKLPLRSAMKRKAPRPSDPEKHKEPSEKTRHYDQDAVRKFMAKQKAERWKKLRDEKEANQKADERKQQIMHDLAERQKQAARVAVAVAPWRGGEGDRKRKSDGRNKENLELNKQDQEDNSTMTEGTEDSISRPAFKGVEEGSTRQRKRSKENEVGLNTNQHAFDTAIMTVSMSAVSDTAVGNRRLDEYGGQGLDLDVDGILTRFSQAMKQKKYHSVPALASTTRATNLDSAGLSEFQLQGSNVFAGSRNPDDGNIAFALGTMNSMAKTNEERKQAIKATALTLQNRLAEEWRKMEELNLGNRSQYSPSSEFVPRYRRIAGNSSDFTVFTSDLPGNNSDRQNNAAMRIQAAYRGHNVRQALQWDLPSGLTMGQKIKGVKNNHNKSENMDDSTSGLSETSTFGEVTATESDVSVSSNMVRDKKQHRHTETAAAATYSKPTVATYKPTSSYKWAEPRPDPYSVMNVFCRQNRYLAAGSRHADMPFTSTTSPAAAASTSKPAYVSSVDLTSLKEPMITSTEHVVYGHTSSGQPVIAKTRYTRVEAVVSKKIGEDSREPRSDYDLSATESSMSVSPRQTHSHPVGAGFSSDDDKESGFSKGNDLRDLFSPGSIHRISDVTDTPQTSEDESRTARSKVKTVTGAWTHQKKPAVTADSLRYSEPTGRLSPNSLANKFSANLNYLESMEESLRQVIGMERVRSVALAQQETVSLAQILKARQQEGSADLQNLQLRAQKEAEDATQELGNLKSKLRGTTSLSAVSSLLNNEDNHRPDSKSYTTSMSGRPLSYVGRKEDLTRSPGNQRFKRSTETASSSITTAGLSTSRTSRDQSSTKVKTAEDSRNDTDSSIKTASGAVANDSRADDSITEEIPEDEDSYSLSFDESVTEVLPSEWHRKELRRWSDEFRPSRGHSGNSDYSSHITPYGDLSSLFAGENSFSRFTAEMVRQIMREEEYRAQHQAALLSLREKALKEKAKSELAWLQQLRQKPLNKAADDVYPNLDKKEKKIRKSLQKQQTEIRRLQEANKAASKERQLLLKQHEEIARIKQNTQETIQKLMGATAREGKLPESPGTHTEEVTEKSEMKEEIKDSKSDTEVYRDRPAGRQHKGTARKMEKQQKMRLDEKYMTAREQRLHERQKQVKELLEWKKKLDAEEEKVFKLEKKAIEAWEDKNVKDNNKEAAVKKTLKPLSPFKKDDSCVISDRMLSSMHDELDRPVEGAVSHAIQASISEAISSSKTERSSGRMHKSSTEVKEESLLAGAKGNDASPGASGSESSILEEIPSVATGDKQGMDSSDDTIINSSVNDDYVDTFEPTGSSTLTSRRKKSPVGKLLLQGSSPLPTPWSRKTGSESESEDSISHTETTSDVSDYEVRIRQLSDELRRRRKEIEILKKERSRRQKEKLKAQEEAMQKQLDAYNNYIQQLRLEKEELEHEHQHRAVVRPQIKQPRVGHHAKQREASKQAEDASSSFEDMRDGTDSNHTSPSVDGKGTPESPSDGQSKRKISPPQASQLLEEPRSLSDKSPVSVKSKVVRKLDSALEKTASSSVDEVIEGLSQLEADSTEKTVSSGLKIQTDVPEVAEKTLNKSLDGTRDEDSYSMDFSAVQLGLGHSKALSPRSEKSELGKSSQSNEILESIEEIQSVNTQSMSSPTKLHHIQQDSPLEKENIPISVATGIQESDSETESRVNSYHTSAKSEGSSRPSSERSLGSFSYSPGDDDEDDVISFGSDRPPLKPQNATQRTLSVRTDENISEHISASLPSISEKNQSHLGSLYQASQGILDGLLDYKEDEDETDKTPVATPREMVSTPIQEEESSVSLLVTDPLTDFSIGDHICVLGNKKGVLRFKGKVDFSPGIWAGVELDAEGGDSDGLYEGRRYFTCPAGRGLLVHGSDILAVSEQMAGGVTKREGKSPDESVVTDQDDSNIDDVTDEDKTVHSALEASLLHSTPISSPHQPGQVTDKPIVTPDKKDMALVVDDITNHLTASLMEDSVKTVGQIACKKSPPPVLPKPAVQTSHTPFSQDVSDLPKLASTKTTSSPEWSPKQFTTDITADGVMKSLLDEAITHILKVKRKKSDSSDIEIGVTSFINGDYIDSAVRSSLDDSGNDEQIRDSDSGLSLEPIQRPGSPIPGDWPSAKDHKKLNDDVAELFGEYIDDDLQEPSGMSSKPPPLYPDDLVPQPDLAEVTPVVPRSKEEVELIVNKAMEIYWEFRRYGEPMEDVKMPPDFLADDDDESEKNLDHLTVQSRRSWKRMLFDLTGEVITDIYKTNDKQDVPIWQKTKHKTQKFFKGKSPPTTMEGLKPVVHAAVFKLLGMNGTRQVNTVNKWNIRKKKDAVDSILVQELGEEELGWVDYDDDELKLKMSLAESIFDSLLMDTVHTLNEIFQKKEHSQM